MFRPTPVAILMQYNSVYAQIGFVTIFISIFVMLISPFIKKLMHSVHFKKINDMKKILIVCSLLIGSLNLYSQEKDGWL